MPKTLPESAKNGIEILIVEDSPTQLMQLQYLLEQNGYQVTTAVNGRLALEVLSKLKPQIVISDILMPEMDGYALCHAIKSDKTLADIPVILVTSLTDLHGIMKGLECGADNFIRKPYDEKYLLSRINYLLMNRVLHKTEKVQMGMEIYLLGKRHFITVDHQQILDLLISVYEEAVHINEELETRQQELAHSNQTLTGLYRIADGLNRAVSVQEVIDKSMECAMELPGMRACWVVLCEDESGFRLAGLCNLPSELTSPGALEGDCLCRRQLLSGELDMAINVIDCEVIKRLQQDTGITGQHISIPIKITNHPLGVMNLLQTEERLLSNNELQTLQGIGNQIAMALMRARMHEHLEQLVQQRTEALTAEIAEHNRTEQSLRATEGRLESILASITDVIWSISAQTHKLQYLNPSAERIYGRPQSDFFTNPALWFEVVHPADRDLITQYSKNLFAGVAGSLEYRIVKPNGEVRWLYDRAQLVYDGAGAPLRIDGITADISERKRLEHRFHLAVESAPNAIVIVNESGTIVMVNSQTEAYFGYSRTELLGQPVEQLVPERFRGGHADFRQACFATPQSRPMGAGRDLYGLRKDGSEFPVEIGLSLIDSFEETLVMSTIVDITERKSTHDKLKKALNEKEVLLKEVYHRVKNNLQVVSSLINLQARNTNNEETKNLLKQSVDRITSMALLHEKLYQSKDLARIDFNAYVHSLVDHLLFAHGDHSGKIKISMGIDDVFLDVDTAIPCGLIINELLSNALKHAFPDDRHGEISITFRQDQGESILVITDNGIGFPAGLNFKRSASLGLQLVDSLTSQLMGDMTLDQTDGSTLTFRFTNIS